MGSFFAELKRRNVFKAGLAYAVAAWLIAQIVSVIDAPLGLPAWFDTAVIVFLAVGFPVVVLVAWAYELTPEGIKKTRNVPLEKSITRMTGQRLNYVVTGLLALAVVFLIIDNYVLVGERGGERGVRSEGAMEKSEGSGVRSESAGDKPESDTSPAEAATHPSVLPNSVAVLPFENLSPDPDNAYFAAGLHEEVLNQLAKLENLTVIARTTMRHYEGTDKTIREVAGELNVETVMEGSVRYADNRVRVTAQLNDPATEGHLWSETYEYELKDIFAIESDIALNVARALEAEFSAAEQASIEKKPTDSPEAYAFYLSAQAMTSRVSPIENNTKGQDWIGKALELGPAFALAWVVKSTLHFQAQFLFPERIETELDAAEQAARRAIAIDPDLTQGHAILASVYMSRGDWGRMEAELRRADALGLRGWERSWYMTVPRLAVGRIEASYRLNRENAAQDPLSSSTSITAIFVHDAHGDADAAWAEYERGRQLFDDWQGAHWNMFITLLGTGDAQRARELAENVVMVNPGVAPVLGPVLEQFDVPVAALALLRALYSDDSLTSPLEPMVIAVLAAYYGDPHLALAAFRDRIDVSPLDMIHIWRPVFREVRRLDAFKEFMREAGLVAYWQEYGWPDLCRTVGTDDFACE